ncbi:MAG: DUF2182 domain-containing protein [Nitrososphaerota archaeon]
MSYFLSGSTASVFWGHGGRFVIILLGVMAAIAGVAWAALLFSDLHMKSPMIATMNGPESFGFFLLSWAVMMVAMMLPAATPMARAYVNLSVEKARGSKWISAQAGMFLSSYLVVWTLFGLGAGELYLLLSGVVNIGTLQPIVAGGALIVAGVYQCTPLKNVCLTACHSPFFLFLRWRAGVSGAAYLGLYHAAYCIGCCWALFLVLFAVGVASLPWMALLTLIIFAEKTLPHGLMASYIIGALFIALGASLIFFPEWGMRALGLG